MAPVFIRSLALVAVRCRYRHGSDPVGEFSFLRIGTGPNPLSCARFLVSRKFRSDTDVLCLKLRRKPLTLALIPVQAGPSAVAPPPAHFEQYSFINRSNSRAIMPLLDASLSRIVADSFLL